MTSLLTILPTNANLIIEENEDGPPTTVEVARDSIVVGDKVLVLPGV